MLIIIFRLKERTAAMGGVSVALKDKSALFNNPAIMAFGDEISVGLHYDNRFY